MTKPWSDNDPIETKEWLDALASLIKYEGVERAEFVLNRLISQAQALGVASAVTSIITPYINTIPADQQAPYPGDRELEQKN